MNSSIDRSLPMHSMKSAYSSDINKCVRCGSCKALCPTYAEDPVEMRGARGRLTLLQGLFDGRTSPSKLLNQHINSCILCGACNRSCPLGIDLMEALYHGRSVLKKSNRMGAVLRALTKLSIAWPDMAYKAARMAQKSVLPALARMGVMPAIPELPESPLRAADQVFKTQRKKRGRVAIFTGCSVNYIYPHFGESLIHVLHRLDYEVILPKGETCCGSPLRSLGLEDEAVEQAKRNHGVFSRLKVEAILSLCPTCTMTLKHEYPKMIGKGLDRAMDISTFFIDKLDHTDMIQKKAFFHNPCHLQFGLGVSKEPKEIIKRAGVELVGPEQSACCGFGGLFCMSNKQLSADLLESRGETIASSGADTVITSCPGCIMQLSRTVTDRPVIHLIELIEDAFYFRGEEQKLLF
ncbi:MAG: hypothetical protein C0402_10415 [Thermodesulfovibrio sp.]|nr:hypothetical protein [Thermodesulfovibrio sp.]